MQCVQQIEHRHITTKQINQGSQSLKFSTISTSVHIMTNKSVTQSINALSNPRPEINRTVSRTALDHLDH